MSDFTPVPPGTGQPSSTHGYFAVFVDRSPVQPGQSLKAVASGDQSCKLAPGCPNAAYFADRQIYTTDTDSFVLEHVNNLLDNRQKDQLHEVTIILLNSDGSRIGESAWYLDFWLPQGGLT